MTIPAATWSAGRPLVWGFATTVVLVLGIGVWGGTTTISGAIIAPGRIAVAQNRQVVEHGEGGRVERIAVAEGDHVEAGDVLITLDPTALQSELLVTETEFFEVSARRARLEAERDDAEDVNFSPDLVEAGSRRKDVLELTEGQRRLFKARRQTLRQHGLQLGKRVEQMNSQIAGINAQIAAQQRLLDLLGLEVTDQQILYDKGLARIDRILALKREQAKIQGILGELEAGRAQASGRITEIELEIDRTFAEHRADAGRELRDVVYRQLTLAEKRRTLVARRAELNITAPVSGIVLGLTVTTPKSFVRPAETLLFLIPQDRLPVVAAQVPTPRITQIAIGQSARVRFSGTTGADAVEVTGLVKLISADAISDGAGVPPYYDVRIELGQTALNAFGDTQMLPGMPVEVFFRTEDRTPFSYVIKPFADYISKAFRDA